MVSNPRAAATCVNAIIYEVRYTTYLDFHTRGPQTSPQWRLWNFGHPPPQKRLDAHALESRKTESRTVTVWLGNSWHYTEPKASWPYSEQPATRPHPEPEWSRSPPLIFFVPCFHLCLCLLSVLFPSGFHTKTCIHISFPPHVPTTCPALSPSQYLTKSANH
jgi:hypothetical protein